MERCPSGVICQIKDCLKESEKNKQNSIRPFDASIGKYEKILHKA